MHPKELEAWNHNRVKTIIDFYGHRFFLGKTVLDLGSFDGAIANAFTRLGAKLTCVDARQEHLDLINKNFPHIRTLQLDLDKDWPFEFLQFDVVLSMGLMCHLKDFQSHLNKICSAAEHVILETEVLDTNDKNSYISMYEDKNVKELSFNGEVSIVNAVMIQNTLSSLGATFKRVDDTKINFGPYKYDWDEKNIGRKFGNRRMWFVKRDRFVAQKIKNAQDAEKFEKEIREKAEAMERAAVAAATNSTPPIIQGETNPPVPIPQITNTTPAIISEYKENNTLSHSNGSNMTTNNLSGNKRFAIVIPSYKNSQYCEKNIQSALDQNYDNYRIIFTDDCSPDDTFNKVSVIVGNSPKSNIVKLIRNANRIGALENLYNMIHSCDNDEIVLTLDGDDWFPDGNVLSKLNSYYSNFNIWMTYGQYKNSTDGGCGVAQPYPEAILKNGNFRHHTWSASHLRTFYAWLFKNIRREDLCQNDKFFPMTWDFAIMFPMLEMAGEHSKYLPDILYVYNLSNPINDHKVDVKLQHSLDRHIRNMPRYQRVDGPPPPPPPPPPPEPKKTNVGLLLIATGKYHQFVQGIISSADKFFIINDDYNVTYYVFTDNETIIRSSSRPVVNIPIAHKQFPFASMDRFKHFTNHADKLSKQDYLYYVDVDCLFVDNVVPNDIISDLVGVRHCGYYRTRGPYETNPKSKLYVDGSYHKQYKHYFGGGFSGGKRKNYLELAKWCSDMIDADVANGVIPVWHDESVLNRYFLDHEPTKILSPSYHYPQGDIHRYRKMWEPEIFLPKILLLAKNHAEMRQ